MDPSFLTELFVNQKAFQWDAYRPLANHRCFGGYQIRVMVESVGPRVTFSPDITSRGGTGCPYLMSRRGRALEGGPISDTRSLRWRGCTVRCNASHGHMDRHD